MIGTWVARFREGWAERYGRPYVVTAADRRAIAGLADELFEPKERDPMIARYLADNRPYYAKRAHSIVVLCASPNEARAVTPSRKNRNRLTQPPPIKPPAEPPPSIEQLRAARVAAGVA